MNDRPDHEANESGAEPPELTSWLLSFLDMRRKEYEEQYIADDSDDGKATSAALEQMRRSAAYLVTTGVVPDTLANALHGFMPGDMPDAKVLELLTYQIVQHRLEFDVAEDVCERLHDLDKRVRIVVGLTFILLGYDPPPTVLKYFQRATTLFLAGYEPETIIMCGAVLESALSAKFPDELLIAARYKSAFRSSDFSVGQRMRYESTHEVLTEVQRQQMRDLVNWRNDAIHVQLDMGPKALQALANLALLLPALLPTGG